MRPVIFLACLLLSGCYSTTSPQETTRDLTKRFIGRPANEFFHSYGIASDAVELADRQTVYRWASPRQSPPPLKDEFTWQPSTQSHYCEVNIYTNSLDLIRRFAITVDTRGKWSASRCSEIFSTPSLAMM